MYFSEVWSRDSQPLALFLFHNLQWYLILHFFQVLLLHKNLISTLKGCERYLPSSGGPAQGLTTLTLNDNQLEDFTELSHLSNLTFLEQFTVANNPCCQQPEDTSKQFDYRPFVINW